MGNDEDVPAMFDRPELLYDQVVYAYPVLEVKGSYDATLLGPPAGLVAYHRALVGFRPQP
jgi:hypothetical protein